MRLFPVFLLLFSSKAFSADTSNVLMVDGTFFIELSIFIFIILFLNKFMFQPLLNLKEDRDIETSVRIERAKSMREQSLDLALEYKKRLSEFRLEIEKSSNEKINEVEGENLEKKVEQLNSAIADVRKQLEEFGQ